MEHPDPYRYPYYAAPLCRPREPLLRLRPFRDGGLTKGVDFDPAELPTSEIPNYDEFGKPKSGTTTQPTPAYKLFEKMIDATLYDDGTVSDESRKSQNTADDFNACDLLAARGECTLNKTGDKPNGTATLTLRLDHLMALDILMLKK